jgi:hypothetical protein
LCGHHQTAIDDPLGASAAIEAQQNRGIASKVLKNNGIWGMITRITSCPAGGCRGNADSHQ